MKVQNQEMMIDPLAVSEKPVKEKLKHQLKAS